MSDNHEISSLSEYMAWIKNTVEVAKGRNDDLLFYRGHSDASYTLTPTVYREDSNGASFRAVEHNLYEEMLRCDPAAFANDNTVLEKLVRMQHYGLPTRLLDLTHSPLVALYFACENKSTKTGEVISFFSPANYVYHPSDIPDISLFGVVKRYDLNSISAHAIFYIKNFLTGSKSLLISNTDFNHEFLELIETCINKLDNVSTGIDFLEKIALLSNVGENLLHPFLKKWEDIFSSRELNSSEDAHLLKDYISLMKFNKNFLAQNEHFITTVCNESNVKNNKETMCIWRFLQQFSHYSFILPPINNERIRRQQGAFVICPPAKTIHWKLENHYNISRIKIKFSEKEKILHELSSLGMNRSYIFPELAELATVVKSRYPARAGE